jgi:hypothetical protein
MLSLFASIAALRRQAITKPRAEIEPEAFSLT